MNWLALVLALLSLLYLMLSILQNAFESFTPKYIEKLTRFGKVTTDIKSSINILDVPKSWNRHVYFLAAFLFFPLGWYEIITAYIFGNQVSEYFMSLLDTVCGERNGAVPAIKVFIAYLLYSIQVYRRFYDSHFVSIFSKSAKMNIFVYALGCLYYFFALVAICSSAAGFAPGNVPNRISLNEVKALDGVVIVVFFWAWIHQYRCLVILSELRKNKKGAVVSEKYEIPQGDLFKYLSSPHVTTEIIMYTALTVLLYPNKTWWCVYALVLTNQVDSIIGSHKWYKATFKKFPKERKAFIPFLY